MTTVATAAEVSGLMRLGRAVATRPRLVLAVWLAVVVIAVVLGPRAAGEWTVNYETPSSDSAAVQQQIAQRFPGEQLSALLVTWRAPQGANAATTRGQIRGVLADLSQIPGVTLGEIDAARLSPNGEIGLVRVPLTRSSSDVGTSSADELLRIARGASSGDVTVRIGGRAMSEAERGSVSSEAIGLAAALVILLLALGTVVAAGLPIATALAGLATSAALVGVLAHVVDTPDWASSLAAMLGIGVGIDYALLIVARFRAALGGGSAVPDAVGHALATAGRSVIVAGATVTLSVLGLLVMGLPYLVGVALAAAAAVLVVVAVSLTLLPALLALAGRRIERKPSGLRPGRATGAVEASPRFTRWSAAVQRRPIPATVLGTALILALALPATGLRVGFPGPEHDPPGSQTREAAAMIATGFGAGASAPLQIVLPTDGRAGLDALSDLAGRIAGDPRVAAVAAPTFASDHRAALLAVQPTESPSADATIDLLHHLRRDVIPVSAAPQALVGGLTAETSDQSEATVRRLPLLFLLVAGFTALVLGVAYRSLLVPLKAAALNLLSIFAAYGVIAVVAQGGAIGQLVGVDIETPVAPFIPILMFAVLFGLSMDYEVFLVGRIRERFLLHGDASLAITEGLATTARVITAAAAIMVAVFGAFALSDLVYLKLIGIGMATAILVDATIIRLLLVPALMQLMGDRAWWMPRWLERLLPASPAARAEG